MLALLLAKCTQAMKAPWRSDLCSFKRRSLCMSYIAQCLRSTRTGMPGYFAAAVLVFSGMRIPCSAGSVGRAQGAFVACCVLRLGLQGSASKCATLSRSVWQWHKLTLLGVCMHGHCHDRVLCCMLVLWALCWMHAFRHVHKTAPWVQP